MTEKMLAGMVYSAVDAQLLEEFDAVKETIYRYNAPHLIRPEDRKF